MMSDAPKTLIYRYNLACSRSLVASSHQSSSSSRYPCFVDPDFPPNSYSLFRVCPNASLKSEPTKPTNTGVLPTIEWCTPKQWLCESGNRVKVFDEEKRIIATDIKQGQLPNVSFLSSLISLTESDKLLKDLIDLDQSNIEMGLFVVRLCKDGLWKNIVVDNYFPCFPQGGPIYSSSSSSSSCIWLQVIEKAYAKYHGSYACIRHGSIYDTLVDLTGSPYKECNMEDIYLSRDTKRKDAFFKEMLAYIDMKYIISLTTTQIRLLCITWGDSCLISNMESFFNFHDLQVWGKHRAQGTVWTRPY